MLMVILSALGFGGSAWLFLLAAGAPDDLNKTGLTIAGAIATAVTALKVLAYYSPQVDAWLSNKERRQQEINSGHGEKIKSLEQKFDQFVKDSAQREERIIQLANRIFEAQRSVATAAGINLPPMPPLMPPPTGDGI